MKRIRFLAAVTGGLVLAAVTFTADARVLSAATDAAAGQLGAHVTAAGMPARLSAQLALAGRRLDPAGPFDAALAAAADRYAHVTRAVDTGLGLPDAAVAAPDDALLFAAYEDGTIRSWDTATGIQRGVGSYPDATVFQLAYDPVHRLLASGDGRGEVEFWQVGPDGEIFPPILAPGQNRVGRFVSAARSVDFYANGSRLVEVTTDGDLFAWSITWHGGILATEFTTVTPHYAGEQPLISASSEVVEATARVPAHIVVALEDGDVVSVELPGARWPSAATDIPATVLIPRRALPATPIVSLAVRPSDAHQLAAATVDGVLVWDLSAKRRVAWPAAGLSPGIGAHVSFTADGSWLVSSGSDGVDAVPAAHYAATTVVRAFAGSVDLASADGRAGALLVTGDGLLCLLDLAHDALLQEASAAQAYGLGFTGGGTLLATSAQGVAVPGDPAPRYRAPGSSVDPHALVVTPSFVAMGAQLDVYHSGVLVWTGPGVTARTLAFDDKVLDAPNHLLYLPDDRLLIARSAAGEIVAWSTTN